MSTRSTRIPSSSSHGTQIIVFLFGTILFSAIFQVYIIRHIKTINTFAMVFLMWVPGVVGIACSKYYRHKFRDLALVKPGHLSLILAYSIPAGASIFMFLVLILTETGSFKLPEFGWFKHVFFLPTIGVLVNGVMAMGQELGWRGFLLNRLMRAQVPEPLLISGLLWAMWYWPLILFLDYSSSPMPWLSVTLFTVQTVSFGVILCWLREFSKSIYPPVLAHAVHLTWLQQIIPGFYTAGSLDPYFGGQSGFVLAITYMLIAMFLYRKYPVGRY